MTIDGSGFSPTPTTVPRVSLATPSGGSIDAPVASYSDSTIAITIPTGAGTGPISVESGVYTTASLSDLTITASSSFALSAVPGVGAVIQGESTTYSLSLDSVDGFAQLATLSLSGLPAGVTHSFRPRMITAGQQSLLTITAPAAQPLETVGFDVTASADVEGIALAESAALTLTIEPVTTTFLGSSVIADTLQTPLGGVTVSFIGVDGSGNPTGCTAQTVADEAGNFALTNLPPECEGPQLVRFDGLTATAEGDYAGVDLLFNIVGGEVTTSPVLIHLPRIDNVETFCVEQDAAQDQILTYASIPDLEVTVYAGTIFTPPPQGLPAHNCGSGFYPLIAVDVPVDRLPDQMPPSGSIEPFIVAFQPANTVSSQPVAVTFPNLIQTPPGTATELSTLDPTQGVMVIYGTGEVSPDGTQIVPDFNPATPGMRYGIVHFDWHGPGAAAAAAGAAG